MLRGGLCAATTFVAPSQGSFGCANSALGCVPRTVIFAHHRLVMDAWDAEIRRAAREMAPRAGVEPKARFGVCDLPGM